MSAASKELAPTELRGSTPDEARAFSVSRSRTATIKPEPHQLWLTDLTHVRSLFGLMSFRIGTIFDAYSRMPLFSRSYEREPSSLEMKALFQKAVRLYRQPRHFVSDKGGQFVAEPFRRALARVGVHHRFGRILERNSCSLIERCWLTLKETAQLKSLRPLLKKDLDRRMNDALNFYVHHRPHMGLEGATPAEVYFGRRRAHRKAVHPPRGRPMDRAADPPFEIEFLDRERRLPILIRRSAA